MQNGSRLGWTAASMLIGTVALGCVQPAGAAAQTTAGVSDAQIEANVLKALASAPELSTQDIESSTVYGVVTLSGTVQNETLRTRAENLVARAQGVKKVVDEMALGTPVQASNSGAPAAEGQAEAQGGAPDFPPQGSDQPAEPASPYAGPPPQETARRTPESQGAVVPDQHYPAQAGAGPVPDQQPHPAQAPYGQPGPYQQPPAQAGAAPYGQPAYAQPQPNAGYPPAPYRTQPGYVSGGGQPGGVAVVVPGGALLQVRVNRGIDSNHIQPGALWDGTVLNDVAAGGMIAIPRGASVQGFVVDSKRAGALKGGGELALQVTRVQLGGASFPLTSTVWSREGGDKSVRTVDSAIGLGALGAILGGVAGGGAGAAIGAGVGAGAGVAGSAASGGGRVIVPPESVLTFHVAQPIQVVTVSQQEMQRLAYAAGPGAPAQPIVRRRYYPGYYGPGYYAPVPYPYPYPY